MFSRKTLAYLLLAANVVTSEYVSEYKVMEEHKVLNDYKKPLPISYIDTSKLPASFSWGDVNGTSYLTRTLNQHLPQYCGSCWAHGALSALGDRIKIARKASGPDINLSIQYILNCGTKYAGSCHGGSHSAVYEFIKKKGSVPYDSCQPYIACSSESTEGFCAHVDTKCSKANTCRTCSTFSDMGGFCSEINSFPNTTIAEYGTIYDGEIDSIKAEIFTRGPVAAGINAEPILDYQGGVVYDHKIFHKMVNHVVSIVGWGVDEDTDSQYWIIRNSWGEYWGEMGYVRVEMGRNALGIESDIAWATPGVFTVNNFPCDEDGENCSGNDHVYVDPSNDMEAVFRHLAAKA